MTKLPLEGLRIIDITVIWAGPFATQLLADWGAEVIRVESCQHWQVGTRGQIAHPPEFLTKGEIGLPFMYPNREPGERPFNRLPFQVSFRNKLSCTMDLTKPKGKEIFRKLIEKSDVFLESNAPDAMEKLGLTYDVVSSWNPNIIMVRLPGFGGTGPYKYYRALGSQQEGFISHSWLRHYPDTDPTTNSMVFIVDEAGGANAALATLMAVHYRNRTGKGQFMDMSQAEAAMPYLAPAFLDYTMNNRIMKSIGNRDPSAIQGCYRCKDENGKWNLAAGNELEITDSWVNITIKDDEEWECFCRAIGNPEWAKDERFGSSISRYQNHEELDKLIEEWTRKHSKYEVMHLLQAQGVAAGPVIDEKDAVHDPHMLERGFFEELRHADSGTHLYPGIIGKMSKTPNQLRLPPCRLGEHNEYVYKEIIGVSDEEYVELESEGHIGMDFVPEIR